MRNSKLIDAAGIYGLLRQRRGGSPDGRRASGRGQPAGPLRRLPHGVAALPRSGGCRPRYAALALQPRRRPLRARRLRRVGGRVRARCRRCRRSARSRATTVGSALRAAGDSAAASEAFRTAAESADDRDLRRLAATAADEGVAASPAPPSSARARRARRRARRAHRRARAHGRRALRARRQRLPYAGRALRRSLRSDAAARDARRARGELHAGGAACGLRARATRPAIPSSCSATT